MNPHRFVPVPLAFGDEERKPLWRCVGCGLTRQSPQQNFTLDASSRSLVAVVDDCPARSFDLEDLEDSA